MNFLNPDLAQKRLRYSVARMTEDREHPALVDGWLDTHTFPGVHDHTGRFNRPDITTAPNHPIPDYFSLYPQQRWFGEPTPVFCNQRLINPLIKRMTRRVVFAYQRFIIKLGFCDDGGINELVLTERLEKQDQQYFLPIVAYGLVRNDPYMRHWVAQPILPFTPTRFKYSVQDWKAAWKLVSSLGSKYHITVQSSFVLDNEGPHPKNWTIWNGAPLVYDYGCADIGSKPCRAGTCKHRDGALAPEITFKTG